MRLLMILASLMAAIPSFGQKVYVFRGQFGGLGNAYSKWTFVSEELLLGPLATQNVIETRFGAGIGGEFSFGYMFRPNLQLSLAYGGYEADDKSSGGRLRHSVVSANGHYYLSGSTVRPFAHAGVGMTRIRMTYRIPGSVDLESSSDWRPIIALGGGADFYLTDETIFDVQLTGHIPIGSRTFQLSRGNTFRSAWTGFNEKNVGSYHLNESLIFVTLSAGVVFRIGF